MLLTTGRLYRAKIKLTWVQKFASAEQVNDRFRALGFAMVMSSGTGSERTVTGTWDGVSQEVELPSQIVNVEQL